MDDTSSFRSSCDSSLILENEKDVGEKAKRNNTRLKPKDDDSHVLLEPNKTFKAQFSNVYPDATGRDKKVKRLNELI